MLKPRILPALQVCCILAIAMAFLASPSNGQGGPGNAWPMPGHDAQNTGRSASVGPATPDVKWTFPTSYNYGDPVPVFGADGTIYVVPNDNELYAINPDGSKRWKLSTGSFTSSPPALGPDGTIYVAADWRLLAVAPDGTKKWDLDGIPGTPCIGSDGTLYVTGYPGDGSKQLWAMSPEGTKKWAFGDAAYVSVIGADGTLYAASEDYTLYALNPDGSEKWKLSEGGWPVAVASDGTIYSYDPNHANLCAIDPTGVGKWERPVGALAGIALAADRTIVCTDQNTLGQGRVTAFTADGAQKWECPLEGFQSLSTPVIDAAGTTYLGTYDGGLYAVGSDGIVKWRSTIPDSVRGLSIGSDGTLYVGCSGSILAIGPGQTPVPPCLSISEPSATGTVSGPIVFTVTYYGSYA